MSLVEGNRELPRWAKGFSEVAKPQTISIEGRKYDRHLCERPLDPRTRLIKIIAAVALTVLTGFIALFFASARELWRECLTGKECRTFLVPAGPNAAGDRSPHQKARPVTEIVPALVTEAQDFNATSTSEEYFEDPPLAFDEPLLLVGVTEESVLSTAREIYDYRELIANSQVEWAACEKLTDRLSDEQRAILTRVIISDCSDQELIKFLEDEGICSWNAIKEMYCHDAALNQAFAQRKATDRGKVKSIKEFQQITGLLLTKKESNRSFSYSYRFWLSFLERNQEGLVSLMENMITDEKVSDQFIMAVLAHASSTLLQEKKLQEKFKAYRGREFSEAFEEHKSSIDLPDFNKLSRSVAAADHGKMAKHIFKLLFSGVPLKEIIRFCYQDPHGARINFEALRQAFSSMNMVGIHEKGIDGSVIVDLFLHYTDEV
ncbi:hypothetical protein [Estrella lausannensis]|uniref:Putative membrane protein n=1 Tax=Estrella lausannensis TaxID=483423 RepID=A0A0H5DRY9_9BACT|nr:hypothetical protein [Estrella lausannensis]CRX39018.1 putative membrane protein [Estrella lausannensis]